MACCSSISDTAVAPSAEVSAATLLVASTEAAGIPVVAMNTGMSTSPPPPMTASIHPANAEAAMSRASMRLLCPT